IISDSEIFQNSEHIKTKELEEFESFADPITRSNSPDSETRSTSAKSDNETPSMPIIKKTK
ncbi:40895_t:CDS:2, partial [Gigaspora margarita]